MYNSGVEPKMKIKLRYFPSISWKQVTVHLSSEQVLQNPNANIQFSMCVFFPCKNSLVASSEMNPAASASSAPPHLHSISVCI